MRVLPSDRAFLAVAALLFLGSAAATVAWCDAMAAMGGMAMPGGWTLSMAWMPMATQTWAGAAAAFLLMWLAMMAAMMLPALLPMLLRYRRAVGAAGGAQLGRLTLLVGLGYAAVWALAGLAAYGLGAALAALAMQVPALARGVPLATGAVVLLAGALQFSNWKTRHLAGCRQRLGCDQRLAANAGTAWRHGLRLGLHCVRCCAGPTVVLLAVGVMDLWTMAGVTAAITAERLAPAGAPVARGIGVLAVGTGVWLMMRAAGLG